MARRARLIVLCEDFEGWVFARRALIAIGANKRELSMRKAPPGKGSGEQYVREQYAQEVRSHRAKQRTVLVVCTDADVGTVAKRGAQLDRVLRSSGQRPRTTADRIAHWIPRRNIETWGYVYKTGAGNETEDYSNPKYGIDEAKIDSAGEGFGRDLRTGSIAPKMCPSLHAALVETSRIRPLGNARKSGRGPRHKK